MFVVGVLATLLAQRWVARVLVAETSSVTDLLTESLLLAGLLTTLVVGLLANRLMTERIRTTEQRADTDPLTGLYNRSGITQALDEMLQAPGTGRGLVAVLFVDVDRLKVVNDSLGHVVGDEVLVRLAQRLQLMADERTIVSRFGGDEFVLVVGGLRDLGEAVAIAQSALRVFAKPIKAGDVELRMDASVGVSFARVAEPVAADELIRDADAAMYDAKRAGGSRYSVFDERLRVEAVDRLVVEQSLSQAVQLEEIETWLQPIVDVEALQLVSLEALVRWRCDDGGIVAPQRFLGIALETGLIVPIGDWVLNEACSAAVALGSGLRVAVNLSEREMADPGCLRRIMTAIDRSGLDPSRLTLEISEDLMVDRLAGSIDLLRTIRDCGVRLSIDDFGTGRSSLSYVKRLDMISEVKIDRTFVADIASSDADRAIVSAVVAMATSLGMEVVAEGVETDAQLDCLHDLGVRLMQGYYFGRPMTTDIAATLISGAVIEDPAHPIGVGSPSWPLVMA